MFIRWGDFLQAGILTLKVMQVVFWGFRLLFKEKSNYLIASFTGSFQNILHSTKILDERHIQSGNCDLHLKLAEKNDRRKYSQNVFNNKLCQCHSCFSCIENMRKLLKVYQHKSSKALPCLSFIKNHFQQKNI